MKIERMNKGGDLRFVSKIVGGGEGDRGVKGKGWEVVSNLKVGVGGEEEGLKIWEKSVLSDDIGKGEMEGEGVYGG